MRYIIQQSYSSRSYWVIFSINGNYYEGCTYYTTRRAAVRAAKKAGGTEEIK